MPEPAFEPEIGENFVFYLTLYKIGVMIQEALEYLPHKIFLTTLPEVIILGIL